MATSEENESFARRKLWSENLRLGHISYHKQQHEVEPHLIQGNGVYIKSPKTVSGNLLCTNINFKLNIGRNYYSLIVILTVIYIYIYMSVYS